MQAVDKIVGLLAPQTCFGCGMEGYVLCQSCIDLYQDIPEPRCAGCRKLSDNSKVCDKCRKWLPLKSIYISGNYDGVNEALVKALKFEYSRQAADAMSIMMARCVSSGVSEMIVCPIPTANARIRQRGFDHALIISRQLAKHLDCIHRQMLTRQSNVRQLGSSRADRFKHMQDEFRIVPKVDLAGKSVLLVDDVMTTGASLAAASKALKKAGAKSVSAVVFAQQT